MADILELSTPERPSHSIRLRLGMPYFVASFLQQETEVPQVVVVVRNRNIEHNPALGLFHVPVRIITVAVANYCVDRAEKTPRIRT